MASITDRARARKSFDGTLTRQSVYEHTSGVSWFTESVRDDKVQEQDWRQALEQKLRAPPAWPRDDIIFLHVMIQSGATSSCETGTARGLLVFPGTSVSETIQPLRRFRQRADHQSAEADHVSTSQAEAATGADRKDPARSTTP